MLGSIHRWPPSLVQNAQLSLTKQPPEDGGLTHQPECTDLEGTEWGAKGEFEWCPPLRSPCRMRSFGPDDLIEIT
jgi:hypothetical protein